MVVIVLGLPGSGKSYFATRLAKKINAEYLNSDRIRKEMFSERTYSEQEKNAVYQEMLTQMKEAVNRKRNVVVDATFHKKERRKLFVDEMKDKGGISFIEVWADENTTRERLKKERRYSEADYEIYKLLKEELEPMEQPHLILKSTNENVDTKIHQAVDYLKQKT